MLRTGKWDIKWTGRGMCMIVISATEGFRGPEVGEGLEGQIVIEKKGKGEAMRLENALLDTAMAWSAYPS